MKVLLVGPSQDWVERHVMTAVHHAGISLQVIAQPESYATQRCEELGIPYREHSFRGRVDRGGQTIIEDMIRDHDPDILHAVTNRALSNALLAVKRLQHSARIIAYRGTSGHLSWFDPAAWMSYLNPRVDRIVCVSDAVRRYLRSKGIPNKKLVVIHKGHDPDWYQRVTPPSRASLGIPDNALIVGFIGNMRPVKGVDVLLRSVKYLPPHLPVHLLLVGEDRDSRLKPLASKAPITDRIHFTGFRSDAVALTGLFDVSVMPSVNREGLPKALIECMSRNIPSIASDVGGMPELIEDGLSGMIVPPRDAKSLAKAVQTLLEDEALRKSIGDAGRKRIEGAFHIQHTVDKTLALYEELVQTSRK